MRIVNLFVSVVLASVSATSIAQYYEYDPAYNLWQTPRDDLMEGREPGPVNLQRFAGGAGWSGIPTFYKLPIALTPEDLKAGDVDIALIGAYTDMGGSGRGAAWGPQAFRAFPSTVGWSEFAMDHMLTLVNPFEELTMVNLFIA